MAPRSRSAALTDGEQERKAPAEEPKVTPAAPEHAVLAMQRGAGNQAVTAMLARDPRKPSVEDRLKTVEAKAQSAKTQSEALAVLGEFASKVEARAEGWELAALHVGSAYKTAANRFSDAMSSDAADAAAQMAIFASVMTVVLVGGLAWLAAGASAGEPLLEGAAQDAAGTGLPRPLDARSPAEKIGFQDAAYERLPVDERWDAIAGNIERNQSSVPGATSAPGVPASSSSFPWNPVGQLVIGEGGDVLPIANVSHGGHTGDSSSPGAPQVSIDADGVCYAPGQAPAENAFLQALSGGAPAAPAAPVVFAAGGVSADPQVYQNDVTSHVKEAKKRWLEYKGTLNHDLQGLDDKAWSAYDPAAQKAAHDGWLAKAGLLSTDAGLPSEAEMADEFERGMWAEYWKHSTGRASYTAMTTSYPDIGKKQKERLKALGVDKLAGLHLTGVEWFTNSHLFEDYDDDDARSMMAWGRSYVPKSFGGPT